MILHQDVGGLHVDLVVSLSQVHLGEDDAPLQPLCKVRHVGEWIGVLCGHQVQTASRRAVTSCRPASSLYGEKVTRGCLIAKRCRPSPSGRTPSWLLLSLH
jgi:hypothetical protein